MEPMTLTRAQVTKAIGINLRGVDALIHRQEHPIPCVRIGRRYLIPRDGLREWLAEEAQRQQEETARQ